MVGEVGMRNSRGGGFSRHHSRVGARALRGPSICRREAEKIEKVMQNDAI